MTINRLLQVIASAISVLFLTLFFSGTTVSALEVPDAPSLAAPLVDKASLLSSDEASKVSQALTEIREKTSQQIAVLTIPSLEGELLEDYSIKVAREWGVGTKDKNNGVLMLIAKDDRKIRIEVGSGLEGDLTDARASRIIRNTITPQFKESNYFLGIIEGITQIRSAIEGQIDTTGSTTTKGANVSFDDTVNFIGAGLAIVNLILWIIAVLARTKSWWAGGVAGGLFGFLLLLYAGPTIIAIIGGLLFIIVGTTLDYVVSKNYKKHARTHTNPAWWAGGGWFGGKGGGSFGGGGFSGGGSSGSW